MLWRTSRAFTRLTQTSSLCRWSSHWLTLWQRLNGCRSVCYESGYVHLLCCCYSCNFFNYFIYSHPLNCIFVVHNMKYLAHKPDNQNKIDVLCINIRQTVHRQTDDRSWNDSSVGSTGTRSGNALAMVLDMMKVLWSASSCRKLSCIWRSLWNVYRSLAL